MRILILCFAVLYSTGAYAEDARGPIDRGLWVGTADILQLQRALQGRGSLASPQQRQRLTEIESLPADSAERRRQLNELMADMAASDELANTPKPPFSLDVGTPPGGRAPAILFSFNRAF